MTDFIRSFAADQFIAEADAREFVDADVAVMIACVTCLIGIVVIEIHCLADILPGVFA